MNQVDMSEISKMYKESPDKYKKPISQDEFDEMVNEKFEPKPEEAHADEQIKAVIRRLQSRELLFRAWNGNSMIYDIGVADGCAVDHDSGSVWYWHEPEIAIMQYTGVKDKNGNNIYDGDILENVIGDRRVVYFNEGSFGVNAMPFIQVDSNNIEIIGNIFEHPELLTHCK